MTMNAHELIESYVADVAARLPRRQRNDVAFELRSLLNEELQGRAADAGREADAAMAVELLQSFGRPAEVAARYQPTLTIIDPADGRPFLRLTTIGLAIIWSVGLLAYLWQPIAAGGNIIGALSQWWVRVVVQSLWWPGVLVTSYGLAAAARRRRPQAEVWTAKSVDRDQVNRGALSLGVVGILCGSFALVRPSAILDIFWGGRAAQVAYDALTYTEAFRHGAAPWMLALLFLNAPLLAAVVVKGRWSRTMRRLETVHGLVTSAVLTWGVLAGPVFMAPSSDRPMRFAMAMTVVWLLGDMVVKRFRGVRPAPSVAGGYGGTAASDG
jgi:hypothetical protein